MDIQFKRGQQEGVERLVLKPGEPAVALDTGNLYIGTTAGAVHVNCKKLYHLLYLPDALPLTAVTEDRTLHTY